MIRKGLLKRLLPFFVALGLGLFVASFFVSIALPNIRPVRRWRAHREYDRTIRFENYRLKEENCRLRREAIRNRMPQNDDFGSDLKEMVPPPPPMAPLAPRATR